MRKIILLSGLMIMTLALCTSCAFHTYHFGVQDRAAMVPDDFGETEAAIAQAEQSEGAKYCPDKIAKAKELAHKGAEVYWACHNTESSDLLAEARKMAKDAEGCGPKIAPAPLASTVTTCDLAVTPTSILRGESADLSWSSQNATKCNIQPDIGPVNPQGKISITPSADTSYLLTCYGPGGKATSDARIKVSPAKDDLCMALNIQFDTDKAEIKPKYFKEIERIADFMKKYPGIKGTIEGHTDNVGGPRYNMMLSQRRAESVMNMLVDEYGIAKSRLSVQGYGLTRPLTSNETKEGRQKNRRSVANFGCQ
jgi:outer membrane protein OmpA-like peptidoglycan-associated protein